MTRDEILSALEAEADKPENAPYRDRIKAIVAKKRAAGERTFATKRAGGGMDIGAGLPELAAKKKGIKERLGEGLETIGRGVSALGDAAVHPVETFTDPSKRRQLLRGVDDAVTLGYGQKLADWAGRKLGDAPDDGLAATAGMDQEVAPDLRTGGQLVGSFMPGATKAASKVVSKPIARILGPAAGPASGALKGTLAGLAGYEATAPALAAAHADSEGDRLGAARAAADDPTGLLFAGATGAAGGAGRGKAAKIRNPKTESGRVLKDIEAAGGRTKMFGEPVKGGLYETPEMKNLPDGRAGTEQLAASAEERMHGVTARGVKDARAQYGNDLNEILARNGRRRFLMANAHVALDDLTNEITLSHGAVADPTGTMPAIERMRTLLTHPGGSAVVSGEDLLKVRKLASSQAFGEADPAAHRVLTSILGAIDKDIAAGQVTPPGGRTVADMNRSYRTSMSKAETANDLMYGKRRPEVERTAATRKTAEQRLMRTGDETVAGLTDKVGELDKLGPEYAEEMTKIRGKKAQERIRRGTPQTSQPLEKTIASAGRMRHVLGLLGLNIGGPLGLLAGEAVGVAGENPLANQVRVTLPLAEKAGKLTGTRAGLPDALTGTIERKRKRQREEEMRQ